MKKGISCESTYDKHGNWVLKIYKDRGKLTLEDIQQAATEWESDYYFLMMKCMDSEGMNWFDDDIPGDCVELYRATDVLKAWERVREK